MGVTCPVTVFEFVNVFSAVFISMVVKIYSDSVVEIPRHSVCATVSVAVGAASLATCCSGQTETAWYRVRVYPRTH